MIEKLTREVCWRATARCQLNSTDGESNGGDLTAPCAFVATRVVSGLGLRPLDALDAFDSGVIEASSCSNVFVDDGAEIVLFF